jgi:hypothetical protein
MAGSSRRFFAEGWPRPKYELPLGGRTLFELSVGSFARYFGSELFVFVTRKDLGARAFVLDACGRLGILNARVVELEAPTRGQAETVAAGLKELRALERSAPLTIFNIDTVRPAFVHPPGFEHWDGYLEVFRGDGSQWSFVEPVARDTTAVRRTTEKLRISDLCSTGLYHFRRTEDFERAFRRALLDPDYLQAWHEFYVAPLYNSLIAEGLDVHYHLVERKEVIFAGTPSEYRALAAAYLAQTDDAREIEGRG